MRAYTHEGCMGTPTASQHIVLTRKSSHKLLLCSRRGFEPRVFGSWVRSTLSPPNWLVDWAGRWKLITYLPTYLRPDITETVDWALKNNYLYLPTYLPTYRILHYTILCMAAIKLKGQTLSMVVVSTNFKGNYAELVRLYWSVLRYSSCCAWWYGFLITFV